MKSIVILFSLFYIIEGQEFQVISSIEKALKKPLKVYSFRLNDNKIKSIPESLSRLKNLKEIILYTPRLTKFNQFLKLKNLEHIHISEVSETVLDKFFETVKVLSKLKKITLSAMKLKNLSPNIGKLENLEEISLANNELETLPKEIVELKKLKFLNLEYNKIKRLPNFPNSSLEELNLRYNIGSLNLEQIFNALEKTKLRKLTLNNSEIKILPSNISNLKYLENLSLVSNPIKELPDSFGELENLSFLFIMTTRVKSFPKSFKNLSNLRTLALSNSPLRIKEIDRLKKLLPLCNVIGASNLIKN